MLRPASLTGSWAERQERVPAWAVAGLSLAIVAVYLPLAAWHSGDADHWFVPWLEQMIGHGALHALGTPMQVETDGAAGFANYNPPYLYLLALASTLSPFLGSLSIVKLVAVAGTLLCAGCVFCLVRFFAAPRRAMFAALALPLLPTAALNGVGWGQTDAIYTGLLILSVAAAVAEHWRWMMVAFGAALAFKLPALFLGPFVLYVTVSRRIPLRTLLWTPCPYLVSLLPALWAGQSWQALASIYLDQAGTYHWLSMKAPNAWSFVQYLNLVSYDAGVSIGMFGTAAVGLLIVGIASRWRLAGRDLVLLATCCALLMPFLLPKMHDRYFYAADMLSFAYAVIAPGRRSCATAAAVQLGSLAAYCSIMFGWQIGPFVGAVFMTAAVALAAMQLSASLRSSHGHLRLLARDLHNPP